MLRTCEVTRHSNEIFLDSPVSGYFENDTLFRLFGWARPSVAKILIKYDDLNIYVGKTISRKDVTSYFADNNLGFETDVHGFVAKIPMVSFKVFSVDFSGAETLNYSVVCRERPDIAFGASRWLFLTTSNNVINQAKGTVQVESAAKQWNGYLEKVSKFSDENRTKWCFCISPGKELVVPHLAPFPVLEDNSFARLLGKLNYRENIVYPLAELKSSSHISYVSGDTHWTDIGAAIAAKEVLEYFEIENDVDPFARITFQKKRGDLDEHLKGDCFSLKPRFSNPLQADLIYDGYSKYANTGQFLVWRSKKDNGGRKLFVSGGSSFRGYLYKFIIPYFDETYFFHGTGVMDDELVREIKPTHILLQNNSRFMTRAPANGNFSRIKDSLQADLLVKENPSGLKYFDGVVASLLNELADDEMSMDADV